MELAKLTGDSEAALADCLAAAPFVQVGRIGRQVARGGEWQPEATVQVVCPEGAWTIVAAVRASGQPRFVRSAVLEIRRHLGTEERTYGVVVAPFIAHRGAGICEAEGIGFADLAGNCRLCFGSVYIERTGRPNPYPRDTGLRSVFSPKASRVLRVLLCHPGRAWQVQELAREAAVSIGHASNVKRSLEDAEHAGIDKAGVRLLRPIDLLREWAEHYDYHRNEVGLYYFLDGPEAAEALLAGSDSRGDWAAALTGLSASARLAPMVRHTRAMVYVDGPLRAVASEVGLRPVDSGANVILLKPYDQGVFYGAHALDGVRAVSAPQAFLDLSGVRGRGTEAAEALLRSVIARQWKGHAEARMLSGS
jgi:hypothetical protein